jgi:hypothetical protein
MFKTKRFAYAVLTLAALAGLFGGRLAKPAFAQVKAALVRDIDNPALQPVQFAIVLTQSGGVPQYSGNIPPVPAGKRLVIETVSMIDNNPGTSAGLFTLIPNVGGVQCVYSLPLQYNSAMQKTTGTLAARMYVDAGGGLYMQYTVQNGAVDLNKYVWISGYYVTM